MDKNYIPYIFKRNNTGDKNNKVQGHKIGVICKNKSGVIILQDIFQILYPNDWREQLDIKFQSFKSEVNVKREKYGEAEVYTVCETDLRVVYDYCDDAPDPDLYQEFQKWLENKLYPFLEIEKPKLGTIIPRLNDWNEEIEKLFIELPNYKIYEELTIKQWLKEKYGIEISLLRDIISKQIDNELAATYRSTTGELPSKTENVNHFRYLDFVLVTPKTNELLKKSDFLWLKDSLKKSKKNNGRYYKRISGYYKPMVKPMLEQNKSINEIINSAEKNIFKINLNTIEYSLIEVIVTLIKNGEI